MDDAKLMVENKIKARQTNNTSLDKVHSPDKTLQKKLHFKETIVS